MNLALAIGRLSLIVLCLSSLYLCSFILSPFEAFAGSRRGRRLKAKVSQGHLKCLLRVSGLRVHVRGALPDENEPFLLLANHVSYWDVIALGSLRPMGFIAKEEVKRWFLLGAMALRLNTVFVKREEAQSRVKALFELRRRGRQLSYCIFPEGTTTDRAAPTLGKWYRGQIALAERPGLKVFCVGLHYRCHQEMAWIDDTSFVPHLIRTLCRFRSDIYLSFSPLEAKPQTRLGRLATSAFEQTVSVCEEAFDFAMSAS